MSLLHNQQRVYFTRDVKLSELRPLGKGEPNFVITEKGCIGTAYSETVFNAVRETVDTLGGGFLTAYLYPEDSYKPYDVPNFACRAEILCQQLSAMIDSGFWEFRVMLGCVVVNHNSFEYTVLTPLQFMQYLDDLAEGDGEADNDD